MAERGLICCAESVRAFLDNRKTQTRRVIKPQPEDCNHTNGFGNKIQDWGETSWFDAGNNNWHCQGCGKLLGKCPYKVGDLIWVREDYKYLIQGDLVITYYKYSGNKNRVVYTPLTCLDGKTRERLAKGRQEVWKSKLLMFKFMARIWHEITGIRVEKIQSISDEDAIAEGIECRCDVGRSEFDQCCLTAKEHFAMLWDSLNVKRGFGWDKNPRVRVLDLKRIKKG